ncbi:MAG: DedA family protein [Longimicrobiaceae bacterium]
MPSDTFVLFGAFLTTLGRAEPTPIFVFSLAGSLSSVSAVYSLARRYGPGAFDTRLGRWLLNERQLGQVSRFYRRWGVPAIFFASFLPTVRAVVPVFAGVSGFPFWRTLIPLACGDVIWYGFLVYAGVTAGRNWDALVEFTDRVGSLLLIPALAVLLLIGLWWWQSRRRGKAAAGGDDV